MIESKGLPAQAPEALAAFLVQSVRELSVFCQSLCSIRNVLVIRFQVSLAELEESIRSLLPSSIRKDFYGASARPISACHRLGVGLQLEYRP